MNVDNESTLIFPGQPVAQAGLSPDQLRRWRLRLCVILTLIVFLTFVVVDSFTSKHIETVSVHFLEWVEGNPWLGVLAVIVVYTIATSKHQVRTNHVGLCCVTLVCPNQWRCC